MRVIFGQSRKGGRMTTLPEMWALPLRMGWSVLPLRPRDKRPAITTWTEYQRHAPDPAEVERWAAKGCNVGVVTGAVSGLLVLDLDNAAAVAEVEARGIPATVKVATAKGLHCYFRHPGGRVKNRAGLFTGADIRSDGGFVVAPGSIHPTGALYSWIASPDHVVVADAPEWLLGALSSPVQQAAPERPPVRSQPLSGDCTAYGRAALEREVDAVRRAPNGRQEMTLNAAGLKLGGLVAGKELSREFARRELVRAGMCMPNHSAREIWTLELITAKVERALADGAASPRSAPERKGGICG